MDTLKSMTQPLINGPRNQIRHFPQLTNSPGVAVINGKILVCGGSLTYEYDPVSDTWTQKANMPTERSGLQLVSFNGKVYAMDGITLNDYGRNV